MDLPLDASLFVVSLPLVEPFRTASGEVDHRSVALVRVGDEMAGWGEAAPYPGQDEPIDELVTRARAGRAMPTLAAALDQAVADRSARRSASPLSSGGRSEVPISVAVGIDGAEDRVDALVGRGVAAYKVKVAPGHLEHVAAIRRNHPHIMIGIDGNRSFDDAAEVVELAVDVGMAYAEELLAPGQDGPLEALAEAGIPHFADESLRSVADARRAIDSHRFTGLTVKPGRLGWTGARTVCDLARNAGVPWRASGLLETGLGRAFTDRLAAEPDAFTSDVAPASWFLASDIVERPIHGASVVVPHGEGLGVAPDPALVDRHLVERIDVRITAIDEAP